MSVFSIQVNQDDYILLQYVAFGLLLLGLHLLATFYGRYMLLGLMLPIHWIVIWKQNRAIKQETNKIENTQNSIKDTCIRYRTEYSKYLDLIAKARDYEPTYTFNNL